MTIQEYKDALLQAADSCRDTARNIPHSNMVPEFYAFTKASDAYRRALRLLEFVDFSQNANLDDIQKTTSYAED